MRNFSNTKSFIEKAKLVHGDTYDYSKVDYKRAIEKILIICDKHGEFLQLPSSHLQGCGCKECGLNVIKINRQINQEDFIKKANKCHNNKYDYKLAIYKTSNKKVGIICPDHGLFKQEANAHLQGNGCPDCGNLMSNTWNDSRWKKAGERSKNFDSYKVYIIKFWNDNEEFYKIGKTFTTLNKRIKNILKDVSYNYKIVKVVEDKAEIISKLEKRLHKKFKKQSYKPKEKFKGYTECFKFEVLTLTT